MKIRISHRVHFLKFGSVRDNLKKKKTSDPDKSWVIERNIGKEDSICMPGN